MRHSAQRDPCTVSVLLGENICWVFIMKSTAALGGHWGEICSRYSSQLNGETDICLGPLLCFHIKLNSGIVSVQRLSGLCLRHSTDCVY